MNRVLQNIEGSPAKHLLPNGEKHIQINEADVAELVDARDLKSVGPFDLIDSGCKTQPGQAVETGSEPADLQNIIPLPDCARHLTRLRPEYGVTVRCHISTLLEQCKNYERGNGYLARRMLETMERIEAAKAAITAGDI